jgi:hypothetical protein
MLTFRYSASSDLNHHQSFNSFAELTISHLSKLSYNRHMTQLPQEFYRYFWDTDPTRINSQTNQAYITQRLLEWGDTTAWRWLRHTYGTDVLTRTVKNSRQISPKTAQFFSLIYDIPQEDIRCLQPVSHQIPWTV